jgi:hypothetical protein
MALRRGFSQRLRTLERIEKHGCMAGAKPDQVSDHAKMRQRDEVGTLGPSLFGTGVTCPCQRPNVPGRQKRGIFCPVRQLSPFTCARRVQIKMTTKRQALVRLICAAILTLPSVATVQAAPPKEKFDQWITDIAAWEQAEATFGKAGALVLRAKITGTDGDALPYKISSEFIKDANLPDPVKKDLTKGSGEKFRSLLGFQKRLSDLLVSNSEARSSVVSEFERLSRSEVPTGLIVGNVLIVSNTEFTDSTLLEIMPALEIIDKSMPIVMLELRYTKVTGVAFAQIDSCKLPNLRVVDLASTPLSERGLGSLKKYCKGKEKLTNLCLDSTTMSLEGLQNLLADFSTMKKPLGLSVVNVTVTDKQNKKLAADVWAGQLNSNFKVRFSHLDLSSTGLTNDGLSKLADLAAPESRLISLQLANNSDITGDGVQRMSNLIDDHLILLNLSGTKATDDALTSLLLKVSETPKTLVGPPEKPSIKTLNISGTYAFGKKPNDLVNAIRNLSNLQSLDVSSTGLTDGDLRALWRTNGCDSLISLTVSGTKVTNKGLFEKTQDGYVAGFKRLTSDKFVYSDTRITTAGLNRRTAILGPSAIKAD